VRERERERERERKREREGERGFDELCEMVLESILVIIQYPRCMAWDTTVEDRRSNAFQAMGEKSWIKFRVFKNSWMSVNFCFPEFSSTGFKRET
jgi:hypothetical protein